jgi:hypothetical protein
MIASRWIAIALLLVGCAAEPPPPPKPATDPLVEMNKVVRENYRASRAVLLARTLPVIVIAFDDATLMREGREPVTESFTPPLYHRFKEIAHIPFGVHVTLAPYAGRPTETAWRAPLQRLLDHALAAEPVLNTVGIPDSRIARERRVVSDSIAYMRATLASGVVDAAGLRAYSRAIAPLVLASADDAAALQIDGLHALVTRWKAELPAADWARLHVLVLGPKAPREGNLAMQYFERVMGRRESGRRLIYSENIFARDAALTQLGGLVIDRAVARDFFAEEMRMDRDLLVDGARRRLDQVFGPVR